MKTLKRVALAIIALVIVGLIGRLELEDAALEHARCVQMVEDGIWPAEVCQ